mgnify:CR=1 FL=1
MCTLSKRLLALAAAVLSPAAAALNIFACEPEWAALATELAGPQASVTSATTAQQDVHHLEARPSLIARLRGADLLICTGLELESGWLPLLLQRAANPRVLPGQPGHVEAGLWVPRLDVPQRLDRRDGDVHAAGNPHIQLDPRNIQRVAEGLTQRLSQIDPANAARYQARLQDFSQRWQAAQQRWQQQAQPLRGVAVVTHHKDMSYLLNWLGMSSVGTLEPKPGVEPSGAHLQALLGQLKQTPARLVLRTPFQSERPSVWLAEKARLTPLQLPFTVGGAEQAQDLFGLFEVTLQRLLAGLK